MATVSSDRLRILLVTRRSAPATGGVESYLRHLSRGLATRHDVTILSHRIDDGPTDRLTDSLRQPPTFAPFTDDGVAVLPLHFTRSQQLRMGPTVGQVIPGLRRFAYGRLRIPMALSYASVAAPVIAGHAGRADVVHCWADGFLALAAARAARSAGRPILITPFAHRGQWGVDPASALAYRRADRAVGLLRDNCQLLRELGVPSNRVAECPVCSPGVERGHGDAWRRQHEIDGPLVAFLGVRRDYKGFDLLLAALPALARRVPKATVVFAGPGDAVDGRQPLRVIDRGRVSDRERAALLEAADVLCLPSAGEIYPSSILEAWSAETAVLTSDIPPLAELMHRSGGGLAVPRAPAEVAAGLAAMLDGRQAEMARAGFRHWRSTATVEAVVDRHVELYREVISERRQPAGHWSQ